MTATATIELYNKIYDKNIQTLDLCYNEITNVCQEIDQLLNLRELYLNNNQITNVCPEIGKLQNLQVLDFRGNKINNVCHEIGQLQNLKNLYLSYNNINNICPEIWRLRNLQELYLDSNRILVIHSEIGNLLSLLVLNLSDIKLTSVCLEIGQLINLHKLFLSYNQITNVFQEIGQLHNLQELFLSYNQITYIFPEIGQLLKLQILYLNDNLIGNICPEIGQLENLQYLNLSNNQITIIPTNIIQCNNLVWFEYHDNNIEHIIQCVQRFLDRIRDGGGTIINIYNDGQNVHTSSIQTSIRNSIFNLLNTHYLILNKTNVMNNYIEDLVLTIKTKQLITEYISIKETHSNFDCTFEEIFKAVWNEILTLNVGFQDEVKKRLNEEMDDAECKCFTGRISRVVNCLSGYSDKVLIQISDAEQIGNIISLVKNKHKGAHKDAHEDSDMSIDEIKQIVRNELTERRFDPDVIEEWISYIN